MCHITQQCGTSEKCCHVKHGHIFKVSIIPKQRPFAVENVYWAWRILTWASDLPHGYVIRLRMNTSLVQRIWLQYNIRYGFALLLARLLTCDLNTCWRCHGNSLTWACRFSVLTTVSMWNRGGGHGEGGVQKKRIFIKNVLISLPYTNSNQILTIHFTEITTYFCLNTVNRIFCYLKPKTFLTDSACIIGFLEEKREKWREINKKEGKEKEKISESRGKIQILKLKEPTRYKIG